VTRSFASFSAAADEAGRSRIYGGIHWNFDNLDALAAGQSLAVHAFGNYGAAGDAETVTSGRIRIDLDDD
jgi:hypothetical protein